MKKIVLGLIVLSSIGFCNDNWKKELDVHKGVNNTFSKETSKFICEYQDMQKLDNEIFEYLKEQDIKYYNLNKELFLTLPELLIISTLKQGKTCEEGYEVTGSCGEWTCTKIKEKIE